MLESKSLAKTALAPGDVLDGKYRIEGLIGRGGMGAVYLARHLELDAHRAIKLMRHELVGDDEFAERFHNEAKLVESLRHSNIVTLYDYATLEDGTQYIVWEYVEGETIRDRLDRGECFSPEETVEIVRQVASGLAVAHEQGILHRDVSPENVILCADGQVKVLDFGVAKSVAVSAEAPSTLGLTFGKIGFASPEQRALRSGELLDARTDVFSLGAVSFAMLTGEAPFRTDDEPAFNHDLHVAPEGQVQRRLLSRLPDRCWHEPLRRALARDRNERPATVEELVRSMEKALDDHAHGRCVRTRRAWSRRRLAAGVVLVSLMGWCTTLTVTTVSLGDFPSPPASAVSVPALAPPTTPEQASRQQEAAGRRDAAEVATPPSASDRAGTVAPSAEASAPESEPEPEPEPASGAAEASSEGEGDAVPPPQPEAETTPAIEIAPRETGPDPTEEAEPPPEPEPEPEPVFVPARRVNYVAPDYPQIASRMGVQGDVVVEATITADGSVTDIVVVRSIDLLDEAAVEAVQKWRFEPATLDGEPVESKASLTVTFRVQ